MEVVALSKGFYDGAPRAVGERFDVKDGSKAAWYAPANSTSAAAKPKAEKVKGKPDTLSQMGKDPAQAMTDVLA